MALGKEIGWRRFPVLELTRWIGLKKAGLISGLIWATWHLPGILSGNYARQDTPLWFQVSCFLIMVVTTAIILTWLRMKSGTSAPAVVFHATHNGVIQMFYDRLTLYTGITRCFAGEFGFALLPILVLICSYIFKKTGNDNINTHKRGILS